VIDSFWWLRPFMPAGDREPLSGNAMQRGWIDCCLCPQIHLHLYPPAHVVPEKN
jgi:hypothetical protein